MRDVDVRTFTAEEAQELVPVLEALFKETRTLVQELLAHRHDAVSAAVDGVAAVDEDAALRMEQLGALLKARLQPLRALGLQVRRVDGLVDIPAYIDGRPAYFCWRFGDERIRYWHPADEGCTERRDLELDQAVGLH